MCDASTGVLCPEVVMPWCRTAAHVKWLKFPGGMMFHRIPSSNDRTKLLSDIRALQIAAGRKNGGLYPFIWKTEKFENSVSILPKQNGWQL